MSTVNATNQDACLLVPAKAMTFEGFREWLFQQRGKPHLRACYLGGDLFIEMSSEDLAEPVAIEVPARAATHRGFRKWLIEDRADQPGRICYLAGDLFIDMSAGEIETHNKIKAEISSTLIVLNKRLKKGTFYVDGAQVSHLKSGLTTVPDGAFVLWETLESGRVKLKPRKDRSGEFVELVGSPDWIMEIVSRTTLHKDTIRLPRLYHQAHIGEFWRINALGSEIDFRILRWQKSGYRRMPADDGWQRSPLFGCSFRLARQEDRLGYWEYTLEARE